jgi:predicted secreted acid phosphatase
MATRTHHKIAAAFVALLLAVGTAPAQQCPIVPAPHLPAVPTPLNLDTVKDLLRAYHDHDYMTDMAAVYAAAQDYVERRAGEVKNPAVVLDIDETALSNWPNTKADDFGYIANGRCDDLPNGPCGFSAWVQQAAAEAFPPALKFFNAVKAKGVAIVFLTGRRDAQRQATLWNLDRAGYEGYAKLITRADRDEFPTAEAYKTAARAKVATESTYTIIASIGDQLSDIEQQPGVDAGRPECGFKLPNPFYFIK